MGRDFSNWIKGRIDEYEFIVNQDYEVFAQIGENSNGGLKRIHFDP
ncbi:antA/AntB antirepressor family protein [Bergeyella cardium]|nr:antA/AntB antirepressor family protein [Bergeyella cardium]WHE34136.1 antA/AntB antirepressor family protein [Bergeyella cardium]WHF60787.1 antA/AntB antirepressor family protein [Bergeyella cardium]